MISIALKDQGETEKGKGPTWPLSTRRHKVADENFLERTYPKDVSEVRNGNVKVRRLSFVRKVKRRRRWISNGRDFDFY